MRIRLPIYLFLSAGAAFITCSCSNTRFIADKELLFTGKDVVYISDSGKIKDFRVKQVTESATDFKPNNSIGGKRVLLPVGLWMYNYHKPAAGKKPGWLYRTLSKEPVLVSKVDPEVRSRKLESELFNLGYFHSKVWSAINKSRKNPRKAGITYYIRPGKPFRYNEISFVSPVDAVDSLIFNSRDELILKKGDLFDMDLVKEESKKITDQLLESGYFYFNQTHIKYTADTLRTPNKIDLRIGKNDEMPGNALSKYYVDNIIVRIIGNVDSVGIDQKADTVSYDGIKIVSQVLMFKPEVIARCIYFRKGDAYSASMHRQTLARLNSYGIFKFINVRYIPNPDTLKNQLDILFELTPAKDISLDLEANIVSKSTGFSGPGLAAILAQGNLAKGAIKLQLKLTGGVEWQWVNGTSSSLGDVSYNFGVSSSVIFPKLLLPERFINKKRFNLPQTSVTVGLDFLNKIQYYRMSSFNLGLGYQWKKPDKITHSFYPAFVNSVALLKTTPEFDTIMMENPSIKKSFEEQFIVGMKYDFVYDNSIKKQPNGFYFQAGVATSGNLLDLINRVSSGETTRPYSFIGNIYSQFIKLSADTRYYRNYNASSLVFRFYSGIGFSYSNSVVMPYVEQFSSGGSNSIRAFQARYVGPGSVPLPIQEEGRPDIIVDQTGDIKLEGNIEYRFKISKTMHGAFFVDAGNVWLLNSDPTRPGGEFNSKTFIDQLAMGTGAGLRFDFGFFVLRTDLGLPLRTAYVRENGSNWMVRSGDVFKKAVFNLAIGYPF
jgi:outer membrane protein assembly factor BamA